MDELKKGEKVWISTEAPSEFAGKTARVTRAVWTSWDEDNEIESYVVRRGKKTHNIRVEFVSSLKQLARKMERAQASAETSRRVAAADRRLLIAQQVEMIEAGLLPIKVLRDRVMDAPLINIVDSEPPDISLSDIGGTRPTSVVRTEMSLELMGVPTSTDGADEILVALAKALRSA